MPSACHCVLATHAGAPLFIQSIAGPLKNAYCVRKSSTITFLCNHAICSFSTITTDYSREFDVDTYLTIYAPGQTRKMHDFSVQNLHEHFQSQADTGAEFRVLDYGCGPVIANVISAALPEISGHGPIFSVYSSVYAIVEVNGRRWELGIKHRR